MDPFFKVLGFLKYYESMFNVIFVIILNKCILNKDDVAFYCIAFMVMLNKQTSWHINRNLEMFV